MSDACSGIGCGVSDELSRVAIFVALKAREAAVQQGNAAIKLMEDAAKLAAKSSVTQAIDRGVDLLA